MKNLVIVESPSKSKTIGKYLGPDYYVTASMGHIRDLSTSGKFGLGVDLDNEYKPDYKNVAGKTKTIRELKKAVKEADMVYLATDPDREGEAISWHLKDTLGIDTYERVVFNEVTKNAILKAFENPRMIDDNLVDSQEARRILDRMIGFRLSKLIKAKTGGTSAGRVQSVALKLIVDREREIKAFIPEEYWTIDAHFKDFDANLFKYKKDDIKVPNEEEADKILAALSKEFKVESVEAKKRKKKSRQPFITSTLQQEASSKLYFSPKKTMMVAQKLYEGINIGTSQTGLITYMRTDSYRLSPEFINSAFDFIEKEYGSKYKGYVKKTKNIAQAQDAHEAIRVTNILNKPEDIKKYLSTDEYKLYNLIYKRSIASLMSDAEVLGTTVIFDNNDYKFKTTGQVLVFDGYLKVYAEFETSEDKILPDIKETDIFETDDIEKKQHFTQPPARYTEASLVKKLEEEGVGRPSTYAGIIETIKDRAYVYLEDKKFVPSETGFEITDKLQEGFSSIINTPYTAKMEEDLDRIANGEETRFKVIDTFWKKFEPLVEASFENMEKVAPKETGETCPECGKPLVIRKGKYGEFVACSGFPECKYIKKEKKEEEIIGKCPVCKKGDIVIKKTKRGKIFYGCNNYPKCKTAVWDYPALKLCPKCKSMLVIKDDKIICSNSDCDYTEEKS